MICFHDETVGRIPVIHACPDGQEDAALPTLIVLHSFGVSAELVSYFALLGARHGLRVLLPSAPEHGSRSGDRATRPARFWPILAQYVEELAQVHAAYAPRIAGGRIALAGTSMGAFATLAAVARHDFVAGAAAYMGTAFWRDAARTVFPPLGRWTPETAADHDAAMAAPLVLDPSARLDRLGRVPLYLWHGARDDVVPHSETLRLAAALGPRCTLRIDPNGHHRVTDPAAVEGVTFLARALAEAGTDP